MPINEVAALDEAVSGFDRRSVFKRVGTGLAGAAALTALSAGGVALTSGSAKAAVGDADIFNFALNLEYLEAEFYLRAATGSGLADADTTGTGTLGSVTGGSMVPFQSPAIAAYAQRIAVDEQAHVRFIRAVLGSAAVARPAIDFTTAFTNLAIAAGLITAGQTFNPFADDISFLLGSYVFEDVGVTAYAGAASLISTPDYVTAAACILAVEAYHAGAIRALLSDLGAGAATDAISALRATLSGLADDYGTDAQGSAYNFLPTDSNSLVFRRTTTQVLNIVYGGGAASNYLFFPNKLNGTIA